MGNSRNSRPKVFCKKGVLRNITNFTGKHLCQSLFFNKVAGLRPKKMTDDYVYLVSIDSLRERILSMQDGEPEGFANFSKNIS